MPTKQCISGERLLNALCSCICVSLRIHNVGLRSSRIYTRPLLQMQRPIFLSKYASVRTDSDQCRRTLHPLQELHVPLHCEKPDMHAVTLSNERPGGESPSTSTIVADKRKSDFAGRILACTRKDAAEGCTTAVITEGISWTDFAMDA